MTAAKLYREAARHLRARRDDFEEDRQQRYLRTRWDDDGRFVYLDGCLPSEQVAPVVRALESRAQEVVLEDDGPLYDRQGARMADALEELVCSSGDRRTPPTLVIHADAEGSRDGRAREPFTWPRPRTERSSRTRPSGGWRATRGSSG